METLEKSKVCRLCGKLAGMTFDVFGNYGNYAKKINSILPISVHEMDVLPKHVCYSCIYKLDEFHKFYEGCLRTDSDLKSQLSWMQKPKSAEDIVLPMVQINYPKFKTEPIDCEEHEISETHVKEEKLTEYVRNDLATFRERIVDYPETECLRCRSFCANRVNHHPIGARFDTNSARHNSNGKKEEDYCSSRDTIKRNLFTSEISEDRQSRIPNENPVHLVTSKRFVNVKETSERNVLMPKIELEDISKTIAFHTLISKKSSTQNLFGSNASSDIAPESKNASTRSKILPANNGESKTSVKTEIKMEILDDGERSLRPRTDMIDYSEPRLKSNRARVNRKMGRIKKVKASPGNSENEKRVRKYKNKMRHVKNVDLESASPILMVKLERQDFTRCAKNSRKTNKDSKMPLKPRNHVVRTALETKELPIGDIFDDISSSCMNRIHDGKNKNTKKNIAPPLLRSHSEYLRNCSEPGDIFANIPKKMKKKNSPLFAARSIKQERSRSTDKALGTILKHQYCDKCNERFASPELYRLHCCYTIKRQ